MKVKAQGTDHNIVMRLQINKGVVMTLRELRLALEHCGLPQNANVKLLINNVKYDIKYVDEDDYSDGGFQLLIEARGR